MPCVHRRLSVSKMLPFVGIDRNCCSHIFSLRAPLLTNTCRISRLINYSYGTALALFLWECAPDCSPQTFRTAQIQDPGSTLTKHDRSLYDLANDLIIDASCLPYSGTPVTTQPSPSR